MAAMTKSTSGLVTTYVITDMLGSTATMAVTSNPVTGPTVTFSSSGGLHEDGLNVMAQSLLLIATNLLPAAV